MRLVCLSDTHGLHEEISVPEGDVLIHAGDLCNTGSKGDVQRFAAWIKRLPHPWKVVIAGNHDWYFQQQPRWARASLEPEVIYLQDSGCVIEGLKIWGSPWQPWFMDWAFNLPRGGTALQEKWDQIPLDTDVLITHGPPYGVRDEVRKPLTPGGGVVASSGPLGCEVLRDRLDVVRPGLHVFGHIHDGYGHQRRNGTLHVNAAICTEQYQPTHSPVIVDAEPGDAGWLFRVVEGGEQVP